MEHKSYREPGSPYRSAGSHSAAHQAYAARRRASQPGSGSSRAGASRTGSASARYPRTGSAAPVNRSGASAQTRRSGASSQPRGGSAPRRPMPRRRRLTPGSIFALLLVSAALLVGVVYTGSAWFISAINGRTYCSNIYVNGIDVSSFSRSEGIQYMRNLVDTKLNAAYNLSWGSDNWTFTAADFGGAIDIETIMERAWNIGHVGNIFDRSAAIRSLRQNPIYLTAPLTYDEGQLDSYITSMYNQLYVAPQNAQIAAELSNPSLAAPSADGQELDSEAARMQIVELIETGEGGSILPVNILTPELSTEQVLNSLELIVDYKTDTTARGYNGRFNVRKALSYFYGMIVQPGEEVSFNTVVGERTEGRGWMLGVEYIGGGKTSQGYGGGVCQASTTLYGALLKAGMTIMHRSPHSMTVSYVDPSLDAAVTDTGTKDLVFRNDTENPITIYTEVTKEYARVMIYGVKPPYRYELESTIVEKESNASRQGFIEDTEGLYCYYVDEFKLYKKGIPACASEGWLVAYDWNTNLEVYRTQLSFDRYSSGYDIYWRGINTRDGGVFTEGIDAAGL